MRIPASVAALFLATGLCACASGGGGTPDPTSPVLDGQGNNAPPSNLVMTDLAYGHRGSDDGVNQTFDLAVTTMKLDVDPGNSALVLDEATRGFFDDGNTMAYNAGNDTFTFDVESGDTVFNDTVRRVLMTNPSDFDLQYNDEAVVLSSVPGILGAFGFDDNLIGNIGAIDNLLFALSESDSEADQELLENVQRFTSKYLANDFFNYVTDGGLQYSQLRLDHANGTTNYTTLGIWIDNSIVGESNYGVAVWGVRTPRYEVPKTGSANYTATMAGHLLQNNNTNFLTGSINFEFDFAAQQFDFTMDADIAEIGIDDTTDYFDYDTFTGSGNVYTDTFLGDFVSDSDETIIGELEGAFFGADADEVAGSFIFGNENVQGIGGFVGANPEATSQQN